MLPNKLTLLRLAASIQDPDLELADLERVVSVDVALSYRLLRYINSAYFSLRQPVSSIGQALALLGIDHVRQWITLTLAAQIGDKPRELFVTALIRARFCQLAGRPEDGPPAELFALGLFSVVDALTDTPMEEILAQLDVPHQRSSVRQRRDLRAGPLRARSRARSRAAPATGVPALQQVRPARLTGSRPHYADPGRR